MPLPILKLFCRTLCALILATVWSMDSLRFSWIDCIAFHNEASFLPFCAFTPVLPSFSLRPERLFCHCALPFWPHLYTWHFVFVWWAPTCRKLEKDLINDHTIQHDLQLFHLPLWSSLGFCSYFLIVSIRSYKRRSFCIKSFLCVCVNTDTAVFAPTSIHQAKNTKHYLHLHIVRIIKLDKCVICVIGERNWPILR